MPHNMITLYFRLPYFHVLNNAFFLHSSSVLSFYVDILYLLVQFSVYTKVSFLSVAFFIGLWLHEVIRGRIC